MVIKDVSFIDLDFCSEYRVPISAKLSSSFINLAKEVLLRLAQINVYFASWHSCCIGDLSVGRLIEQIVVAISRDFLK